jgi:hypothetical protein
MTEVRPRLTEIVDAARDRNEATAMTEYGRPRAFVVSVPFFERAERDSRLAGLLWERDPQLFDDLLKGLPDISVPSRMVAE